MRSQAGGYQISEFAVSMLFLIACVALPLLNLSVIPLRWGLAHSLVSTTVQQKAQCETLSQALQSENTWLEAFKKIGGITVKSTKVALLVESAKMQGQTRVITKAGSIPGDWLPNGPMGPYVYRMDLTADCEIAPLVLIPVPNVKIPGLTSPFAVSFNEKAVWENTGRDSATGEFFVNE